MFRCISPIQFCFDEYQSFLWTFTLVIALTRHFKGHMKILASALYHKSHYPECHYQHSMMLWHRLTKILFFSYKYFLKKIEHLYRMHPNILSFVIQHQYHFDAITHFSTIFYPFIQRRSLVFKTNGCLNSWKHPSINVSEK